MSRWIALLLAALAVPFAAAGCGGDGPTTSVAGPMIDYTLVDYRVRPQQVSAPAGRLQIRVRNAGRLAHNLHISGRGGARLQLSAMLPGDSETATVKLPKGRWKVFCSIANHEELGMYGWLVTR
jgi:plastocyanin